MLSYMLNRARRRQAARLLAEIREINKGYKDVLSDEKSSYRRGEVQETFNIDYKSDKRGNLLYEVDKQSQNNALHRARLYLAGALAAYGRLNRAAPLQAYGEKEAPLGQEGVAWPTIYTFRQTWLPYGEDSSIAAVCGYREDRFGNERRLRYPTRVAEREFPYRTPKIAGRVIELLNSRPTGPK